MHRGQQIVGCVDVKERSPIRIKRRIGRVVRVGPNPHLAHARHQISAQLRTERNRPKAEYRLRLKHIIRAAKGGDTGAPVTGILHQTCHQRAREKRRIARDRDHRCLAKPRRPVHRRQDTRKRTRKVGQSIGQNGQAKRRKPQRITVCIDRDGATLSRQLSENVVDHPPFAQWQKRLVSPVHPCGPPPCEDNCGQRRFA